VLKEQTMNDDKKTLGRREGRVKAKRENERE